ncbi:MAG: glycosyltransferase family 1 protein [Candidatus Moranbacteria bacterium]|nr:glycosyltransferase family 1 protein [Candidatus Moranbacteria bacterium]
MQIGIDIRNIGKKRTGDEVVFFNLVKNLALIDVKNNYQLFTDIRDPETLVKIKSDLGIENKPNFEIISLATKNKFSWNFWTLPKYLRANPIDLYLTQYITPFFVPKKIKILTVIHDVSFRVFPSLIKFDDLFFLRTLIPLALKRADKIIAVSKFTQEGIISYYEIDPKKVDHIHNAVADDFLTQTFSQAELEKIRQKYNLPEKFIFYIGTLQPRKNLPVLVEAYAKIKNQLPGVKLVLAGGKSHNYDSEIDAMIKAHTLSEEEVIFPGFIPEEDKKAVMQLADCFCFPSLYEGFGIPILEAFSVGLPAVISDIPSHREIAGDAALYFAPNDSADLAQKLLQLLSEDDSKNQSLGKEQEQLKLFSWAKTAEKMLEIFESLEG